jgi:uncharacterized membrane protein
LTSSPEQTSNTRRQYIDYLRGVAVLIMLLAHTFDAWTADAERSTAAFHRVLILGGFGAPLFLWLAGVASVLSAERACRRSGSRKDAALAVFRRGVEIFILAFLFRLQAFIVSPGASPVTLFRVDILNIMGPSIAAAGLVWGLSRSAVAASLAYASLAIAFAMSTPLVRIAGWVNALPIGAQWYLRPAGDLTNFTLFPWAGFVFAGGAVGVLIAAARDQRTEVRVHLSLAAAGAALIASGFCGASLPTIYRQSSFWTSSPTYFAIRTGVMMLALTATYGLGRAVADPGGILTRLEHLGRRSLFVYWIHVELVYGYATWPIRHKLEIWETALAWLAFSAMIYGCVVLRDRLVDRWRTKGSAHSPLYSNS